MDGGVLLIERRQWWRDGLAPMPRDAAVELTEEELTRRYRGIDGSPWPDALSNGIAREHGVAKLSEWPAIRALAATRQSDCVYDTIVIERHRRPVSVLTMQTANALPFLGYDFGYYDDPFSVFSSIFHESIHGTCAELRAFATRLNANLLFPDRRLAEDYRRQRDALAEDGRDLEGGVLYAISIFGDPAIPQPA